MRTPTLLPALLLLAGCTAPPFPLPSSGGTPQEQQQQLETVRQDLDQIPPPSKTRYMAIKNLNAWQNPYLTIQGKMVTLHVTQADANQSDLGIGGMLRPIAARRQDLNVRTSDLAAALNAVPQNAWPYGRVVAIEEAHDAPPTARPELRRNMESAMKLLNDVGIVVYEWQDGSPVNR